MNEYKYYVGGDFRSSAETIDIVNPSNEEVFAKIFEAEKDDLGFAIEAARKAQRLWKKVSFKERAKVLREIAGVIFDNLSSLAEIESKEIGKILKESLFVDVPLAAECFNYYASFLEVLEDENISSDSGLSLIKHEPFGVCAAYLPFNVPLMAFGFSCAGALAAGNSLIIKPSEYGSLSILELAKHIDKLDIPKGLVNIITGKGQEIGRSLSESQVDIISFTGSKETLRKVIAQSAVNPKKIICELGGCNLVVVFSDSDIESAMQNVLGSSFMKQGQMCIGTSVVLVEQDSYKEFVKDLVGRAQSIKIGDPFESTSGMGAVVTSKHLLTIDNKVKAIIAKGGKVLCGGKILEQKGYFYPPTIIEVDKVFYEEIFAPVILIKSFKDRQEAEKALVNNPTGLVAQIWTKDIDKANSLAANTNSGTVWINTFVQMSPQTPFGGMSSSGWGRNLGKAGFFEYTQSKHIGIGFKKSPVEGWFGV